MRIITLVAGFEPLDQQIQIVFSCYASHEQAIQDLRKAVATLEQNARGAYIAKLIPPEQAAIDPITPPFYNA